MRKLHYILAGLVLVTALVSCEKQNKHDLDVDAMKAAKTSQMVEVAVPSGDDASTNGAVPMLIPAADGKDRGGNRTCEDVKAALDVTIDFCGEKIDYNEDRGSFEGEFPEGLSVTVDDIYVSFEMRDCIFIGEKYYKVSAVIVKGSNAANVYVYPDGILSDSELFAPGEKPMVSNLTFCFMECDTPPEDPELVIGMKAFMNHPEGVNAYIRSGGENMRAPCPGIGYNEFIFGEVNIYAVLDEDGATVGTITAIDGVDDVTGPFIAVTVDTDDADWIFAGKCYLYIGSIGGWSSFDGYGDFPFTNDAPPTDKREFFVDLDEIIF